MDLRDASLNSVTVKGTPADQVVDLALTNGFGGVGLWRDTLEGQNLASLRRRATAEGIAVTSVCRGGMFTHTDLSRADAIHEDNCRAVEQAHDLGAECLVLVCGPVVQPGITVSRSQIADGIAALEPVARAAQVRLAVEPMHPMMAASRSAITSLQEATALVRAIGSEWVGLAIDAYHVWWDHRLDTELDAAAGLMASIQVADWVSPICDELDSRAMPGDGCIDLTGFIGLARQAGYRGLVEIEVLSRRWWAQSAQTTAAAAAAAAAAL
ncbi:sugar phosphate isomerase/epimerase family protein [Mycobacterium aquaticum]|uniref:Xylose isomerase n=1 Tax=Mycobacterium aquaticum TaxID=1927124 RepID=A0A1X0BA31_9MYCO|nr:sugar phosphate isomerase/epimerase family protein [Mycobacterium aquaticum]ORA39173.1 xylose isomerase [Mycobacterium aquaticum]